MNLPLRDLLDELKTGLQAIYGGQLAGVYLFGSYARGEAHPPNSDVDILIALHGDFDYWKMNERCSVLVANLSLKYDVLISRKLVSHHKYLTSRMPLYENVRLEGIAI